MKINPKAIMKNFIFVLLSIIISYGIASVLILGDIKRPYDFGNSDYFNNVYDVNDIAGFSNNFSINYSKWEFKTNTTAKSTFNLTYNEDSNTTGYVVLDFDVLSEKSITIRVCIFDEEGTPLTFYENVTEGINIIKVPLMSTKSIRIDFPTDMTTYFKINEMRVSNQLIGILPLSWYVCFAISLLISLELFGIGLLSINLMRKIYEKFFVRVFTIAKTDINKFIGFIKLYKKEFLICTFICIFAYGYFIMNFSLGIDDERDFVQSAGTLENVKQLLLTEGRIGGYIFRTLETIDGTFTPFVDDFVSVACMLLTIIVLMKATHIVTNGKMESSAIVIFGGMFVTLPFINTEIMSYSIANGNTYFSMLVTTTALLMVSLFYKNREKHRLVSAVLLTLYAIYSTEANNVWFIVGTVFISIVWVMSNKEINFKKWFLNVMIYAGTYIVAFVLYILCKSIIKDNGYIADYFCWKKGHYIEGLKGIFTWMRQVFTNENLPGAIYMLIGILMFIIFIISYISKEKKSRAFLILFLAGCLLFTPFILCFVAGRGMPYRTMIGLILLESGIWFIMLNYVSKKTIQRFVFMVVAVAIIWKQSVWTNRIFYGADLCSDLDMQMGYAIGEEIERVTGEVYINKPVVFVGKVQHSSPRIHRIDAVGHSIFYRPSSKYKVFYLRYLGFNVQQAGADLIAEAEALAVDMKAWPLEGSVKEFDNVIVVKLN